jgi:hypothetical protein
MIPAQLATMTAARAIIKKNGKAIGYIRGLRLTENKQRGSVMGVGEVTKKERPLLSITCTWSCDFYLIDLLESGIPDLDKRDVQSIGLYKDTQTLLASAVDIQVYKKDVVTVSGGVVTKTKGTVFCTVNDVYLDSTSWDITENQISMFNQSGEYTSPVILAI